MEHFQIIVLFVTTFIIPHCAKAESNKETILYLLNNTAGINRFASWIQDIEGLNNKAYVFTVFAFNDTGYEALPSEERQVLDQLDARGRNDYAKDFIVHQKYGIGQLYDGLVLESVSDKRLFINQKNVTKTTTGTLRTFVNGGMIIREELQCSNGIIHVLERPLSPIKNMNVLEYIEESTREGGGKLNSLIDRLYFDYFSVTIAPLANEQKMTFLMPSQQSMEKIPDQKLNALSGIHLAKTFQMHFIPRFVVFTNVVDNYQSFTSGNQQSQIIFHKEEERISVSSGGVTAEIIQGNITLNNGVLHIIDGMLGFVYNTALEQIEQDAIQFINLIPTSSSETMQLITQSSELNMFIPMDMAFTFVRNLPGINIDTNQTLIDMIIKLSMIRDGSLTVSKLGDVTYENRQRRISFYNDTTLVIYKANNEVWVNGGNVRARIIRPDVAVTNGGLQYIDRILGIPTMDMPMLIYDDGQLLRSYSELKRLHLLSYLADPLYNRSAVPIQNNDQAMDPHSDIDNTLHTNESLWCDERCSSNLTDDTPRCQFSVFLPSSIAFEQFYSNTEYNTNITQDICRFRYVLRRHIIPHEVVSLEAMSVASAGKSYNADNGDEIIVWKVTENDVLVKWGKHSAGAIMWDLGATNGIVHIIDSILSDPDDETVDIGLTTPTVKSTTAMSTSVSTATVSTVETVRTTVKISGASVPHTNFICLILVLIFFN